MPRELLILRHAKSDWDTNAASDFERPLAKRGRKDAPRVGEWLYREGLIPRVIVSSPAQRARETTLKVCKCLDLPRKDIVWDEAVYDADLSTLLAVLARMPSDAELVLLVGHNPGLEELLRHLAGSDVEEPTDGKLLPTATVARLEMPNDWSELAGGCAGLVALVRPKQLK
ncbi:MAG: histidine phosphatase family protein [Thiohalocapsa sp.]|jgi:phosphohistidine phosphatase|uniref:SixA phosphatase family protein n=1 Tax=Thiohalocapsa sp. TaxID=2497641 RepID=UPI0025E0F00E|nr:histidine phosphatase family protein [Thiohalocapsa sp.]MCG6940781.1 histidine phosphatase family protein [Thiohalocapsa sp.]